AEGSHESTTSIARFGGCDSREGPSLRSGAVNTGACYGYTGTDWGVIGVVSLGTGTGTGTSIGTGTASGPCSGTDSSSTATIGIGSGLGCIGRAGPTSFRSQGTSPTSHGGTGP
ncbi:hypothetical protein KI387_000207, partial [Taxus chinensis]